MCPQEYIPSVEDEKLQNHSHTSDSAEITTVPPDIRGNSVQRKSAILQMQRQYGNAYVQRYLATIQRDPSTSEEQGNSDVAIPQGASTSIGDGSASISAQNGIVTIDASMVNINAPITNHSGIDRSTTVIADSVVASSYTPGAGNIM
ncbi:MAG: hypothetical protein CUN55_16805 [Phototrophicales bacterium]|nr:MAG: hypothetical protein CUN55_16805 [Phototrophicales bacterium]